MTHAITDPSERATSAEPSEVLRVLLEQLCMELSSGDKPCAAFTSYATAAYADPAQAQTASRTLVELFLNKPDALATYARVVDVAAELACESSILAHRVCALWDTPRDEHKLLRLADELLNGEARFQNHAAQCFTLELARRLSPHRPDYATRLIDHARQCTDSSLQENARTWLKAGEFLRTQTEAVRFFWQRHLRGTKSGGDLKRMSARIALDAVRKAPVEDSVCHIFRDSVPEQDWDNNGNTAQVGEMEAAQVSAPTRATEEAAQPAACSFHDVSPTPLRSNPRASLLPAYTSNGECFEESKAWFAVGWNHPVMGIAAGLLLCASVVWFVRQDHGRGTVVVTSALNIKVPTAVDVKPKPAPLATIQAVSSPRVVPATATKPTAPPAANAPAKPKVVASTPHQMPVVPASNIASAQSLTALPLIIYSSAALAHHIPLLRTHPPMLAHELAKVKSTPPSPSLASAQSIANKTSEPEKEIIAKPMRITDYDRWVMQQAHELSQRYPELRDMQQAVVKGNWTSQLMKLDGNHHITEDHERYVAVLRWLVIDPPLGAETRRIIYEKWADESSPDECIALWERMLQLESSATVEIAQAARRVLARRQLSLTKSQQERLQQLSETAARLKVTMH